MKLIGVGDNVCDVYTDRGVMYPGGQALNVAVYASMLGACSAYMGVFGDDAVGQHVQDTLCRQGVEKLRCRNYEGPNGYALVTHEQGDRVFIGSNRGGALREHPLIMDAEDLAALALSDVLHTSNNSYLDAELPKLGALSTRISYDLSGAWRDTPRAVAICPYIDYAFLSLKPDEEDEIEQIAGRFHEMGAAHVVLTMGARGAWYFGGGKSLRQPPQAVKAVDTLGAGDSFAAAFLVNMESGVGAEAALKAAAFFSASVCLMPGAFGCEAQVPPDLLETMRRNALPPQTYIYPKPEKQEER